MTSKMIAAHAEAGQPLRLEELPRPQPKGAEILIGVEAAGLNRADLAQRAGHYPPPPGASAILGLEVSGIVLELGPDVTRWRPGDRVCALLAGGGYASHVVVDEGSVLPVPENLNNLEAACLPEAMMTVWANVFDRAGLSAGETFLCHGATSGIGVMAVQMARVAGAGRIIGTAGSWEKCAKAEALGAHVAINYREQDFEEIVRREGGADVILDMVGGAYIQKNISAARPDGRIINIAYQSGMSANVNFGPVLMKRLSLMATTLRARPVEEKSRIRRRVEEDFWAFVASGEIKPVIDSTYRLEEAEKALEHMAGGGHSGKILLTV